MRTSKYPNRFGTFHICGAFWKAPNTGTDPRAGTLIYEVRSSKQRFFSARNLI